VGKFVPHPTGTERGGWVVYERKRAREEIWVPKVNLRAKAGDWVKAKLTFHEKGPFNVTAELTEVFGTELPASADIGMISAEYNLIEEHPRDAVEEAERFKLALDERNRRDLRDVPFITIDGETARDFDDAVYVARGEQGFILWVAIADVSHYVAPGTALDREARSRGTSVYFPERAFHMLPRALSENLCSLRPNEPRLAMTAKMHFDAKGKRVKTELMESIIESRRRATYNEIQKEWDENRNNLDWKFRPHFDLYQLLRAARSRRGSIDFDLPEAEVRVDAQGVPISIRNRERWDSHRLIEEFMISANEAVTEWIMTLGWPFVYRVHDEPAETSLVKFQKLATTVGVTVSLNEKDISRVLSDVVRRLEGHPAQALLNMALLRSMKQAQYSATHGGHFGLASEAYTHFTSPIRRYPDLVVHRMLRMALRVLRKKEPKPKDLGKLERELEEVAEHCSYRERIAADAERESIKLKQVRAMIPRLGDEFTGRVIGMANAGLFVEILDPYCEGLISGDSMVDDFYQFNEERMVFVGKRKKRAFRIGDQVEVRALRADIDRRQIDFGLLGKIDRVDRPAGR
jgi:ribonuclease R